MFDLLCRNVGAVSEVYFFCASICSCVFVYVHNNLPSQHKHIPDAHPWGSSSSGPQRMTHRQRFVWDKCCCTWSLQSPEWPLEMPPLAVVHMCVSARRSTFAYACGYQDMCACTSAGVHAHLLFAIHKYSGAGTLVAHLECHSFSLFIHRHTPIQAPNGLVICACASWSRVLRPLHRQVQSKALCLLYKL